MDSDRRTFLKDLGLSAVGIACGAGAVEAVRRSGQFPLANAESSGTQWAMVIDIEKCLNEDVRDACVEACNREHNVPSIPDAQDEVKWIWSEQYAHVFPDQTHARTAPSLREAPVLVLCNHCTNPSCVKVCPTGATWKREEDGLVLMDMHRCIGCRYCMAACPYGARSFNWRDPREFVETDAQGTPASDYPTRSVGVVEKCTFCAERIRVGETPACVEAAEGVPGAEGALTFGDVNDPNSGVSRILSDKNTICRRVGLGNGPNVYYVVPGALPATNETGEA
jgi:Fe-S-cluster-containing dehydrogenase component